MAEYKPADNSFSRLNTLSTLSGEVLRHSQATATIKTEPSVKPSKGDTRMQATVFRISGRSTPVETTVAMEFAAS
jgi:hypothetical protein